LVKHRDKVLNLNFSIRCIVVTSIYFEQWNALEWFSLKTKYYFFLSDSLFARIHPIRWISEASAVRTSYALSCQLSYGHGTRQNITLMVNIMCINSIKKCIWKKKKMICIIRGRYHHRRCHLRRSSRKMSSPSCSWYSPCCYLWFTSWSLR